MILEIVSIGNVNFRSLYHQCEMFHTFLFRSKESKVFNLSTSFSLFTLHHISGVVNFSETPQVVLRVQAKVIGLPGFAGK